MGQRAVARMILAGAVSLAAVGAARADGGGNGGAGGILQAMISAINSTKPDDAKIDPKDVLDRIQKGNQKTATLKGMTAPTSNAASAATMPPALSQLETQLVTKAGAVVNARNLSSQAQAELDKVGGALQKDLGQIAKIPPVNKKYDDLTKLPGFSDVQPQEQLDVETLQQAKADDLAPIQDQVITTADNAVTDATTLVNDYNEVKTGANPATQPSTDGKCAGVAACKAAATTAVETALTNVNAMRKAAGAEVDALAACAFNARRLSVSAVSYADQANPSDICARLKGNITISGADARLYTNSADAITSMIAQGKQIGDIAGLISKYPPNLCGSVPPSAATGGIDADP